jgi:hypothetical protein
MKRLRFWNRTYLIEPKIQIRVTLYVLAFAVWALAILYYSVRQAMLATLERSAEMVPACRGALLVSETGVKSVLASVFTMHGSIILIFAYIAGILISHRIVGPIYRFKRVIRQIADGQDPGEIRIRKADFFEDMIPLLQDLHRSRQKDLQRDK